MWVEPAFADQRFRIVIGDISSEFARPVWLAGSKPTPGLSSSKLLSPCASFCSQAKYRRAAVSDIAFFPRMTRSSSLHPVSRAKGGSRFSRRGRGWIAGQSEALRTVSGSRLPSEGGRASSGLARRFEGGKSVEPIDDVAPPLAAEGRLFPWRHADPFGDAPRRRVLRSDE